VHVASEELFEKEDGSNMKDEFGQKAKELVNTMDRYRNKINHITWREQQATRSVKRLGDSPELQAILDKCCLDIVDGGRRASLRLEEIIGMLAKASGVVLTEAMADKNVELNRLVPEKLFNGTLSFELLKEGLDEKEFEWYLDIDDKDAEFSKKAYEILNFMNGKRNLYEIQKAVSAEYSDTDPELVLRFVRDLEKLKLVSLKQA
jgi:hypothetical protein